jgi:glutathione peroxidase
MRPRGGVVVGLLVGCVIVAGCGSDSSDSSSEEPPAARDTTVQPASPDVGSDAPEVMPSADHVRERERADPGVLRGTFTRLNGARDDLSSYRGRVVLVVNTATECGFTPQFEGLEALYKERRSDGFVVLGFPANDFAQESRSDDEIAEFCKANYGVTFPMFAKSELTGDGANALFGRLNEAAGAPEWNFNKYLVDRRGKVVARFGSGTEPDGAELAGRLEKLL